MNLNECIIDEFPSPEYDRDFINELVNNYSGDINPNGDFLDNIDLWDYIWECLEAIEHPSTIRVDWNAELAYDALWNSFKSGIPVDVNERAEKDEKYKVVLAPSFPEEYRSVFEDILEEWEKEDKKSENNA
jgi:hypothetical protein|tara:strand:- start:713 stop:1105 length:393 start_codon:yes stop_codon:yes gene_type:complete